MTARALRSARASRAGALAASVAAALALFGLVYGGGLLRADAPFWTHPVGDMGQMVAGEIAALRAPWGLPLLVTHTLDAPDAVPAVYTDSIPWLTAILKALHLGDTVSLLGGFLLLEWIAQPLAAYALLRACGIERPLTLVAGALLALLMPAWLARQIGHIALSAQAFEMAGLALAVHAIRTGLRRGTLLAFFGLAVVAVGVHGYHVPQLTLMFAVALASDVAQGRPNAVRRALLWGPAFLLTVGAAAWVCGYTVGRGPSGGAEVLGVLEMNALAPFVPQASALVGSRWLAAGWFTKVWDPAGHGPFEGFNYLGGGLLLLVAAAIVLLWRARRVEAPGVGGVASAWRRWGPLWVAFALLTAYAIGPKPWVGPFALGAVPLPRGHWFEPFAMFRGHGRFFWTVSYGLLAGSLGVVDRLADRWRRLLLFCAVALQAFDMSVMLGGLHARFSQPEALLVPSAFEGAAFRGRPFRAYPGFFCTHAEDVMTRVRQVALIAQRQGADTNSADTVRAPRDGCPAVPADLTRDAAPGDGRITMLQAPDALPAPYTNAFAARRDCFAYGDGVWFCGRGLVGVPGLSPIDGRDLVTATTTDLVVDLAAPPRKAALDSGWSTPEGERVWSDGRHAVLKLPRPSLPAGAVLTVTLEATAYQPPGRPPQRVRISVAGRPPVERTAPAGDFGPITLRLPASSLPPGPVTLDLDLPDAVSPKVAQPPSDDGRLLAIGLRKVTLAH